MFAVLVVALAAGGFATVFVCDTAFVTRCLPAADAVLPTMPPTIAVIFSLFFAFGTAEISQRSRELGHAVQKEVSVARAIYIYAESVGGSANPLRAALTEYLQAVTTLEQGWLEEPAGTESPAQLVADALVQVATLFSVQSSAPAAIKGLVIAKVDELRQARTDRISLSTRTSGVLQWNGLLVMALLTQLIIALAHVGRRNAKRTAVGCFSVAAIFAISYMAWVDGLIGPSKIAAAMQPLKELMTGLSL